MTASPPGALMEPALVAARPRRTGRVVRVVGLSFEVEGVDAAIGDALAVRNGAEPLLGEVVALSERGPVAMPFGEMRGWLMPVPEADETSTVPIGYSSRSAPSM